MRQSLFFLAAGLSVCTASSAANLIVGGGFEAPVAPALSYLLNATPAGWLGTGDLVAQGYAGAVNSGDGNQWFDLNPGTAASTGISQVISLSASSPYVLSFLYNGGQPSQGFTTAIAFTVFTQNGALLSGSVSTASMNVYAGTGWALYSGQFAAPTNTTATVHFQPNGVWANGFIDAVSVSAVPEVGSQAMILLGLVVLAIKGLTLSRRSNAAICGATASD